MYGVLWCFSLYVIAVCFSKTRTAILHRADGEIAKAAVVMYVASIVLSASCILFGLSNRQGRRRLCITMQLLIFSIFLAIFHSVFDTLGGESLSFSIGHLLLELYRFMKCSLCGRFFLWGQEFKLL